MTATTETRLPVMVDGHGEMIQLVTAEHLLQVAGLAGPALREAEYGQLGVFVDNAHHLTMIAKEATGLVGSEVIRRLDRGGRWTVRDGGFEFKAPSPEAGTTKYDTDQLREALELLRDEDLIDQTGADGALQPVPATVAVTDEDLDLFERVIAGLVPDEHTINALGRLAYLRNQIGETSYTQKPAGIKALLKLGGDVAAAIQACQVAVEPPPRKASIKPDPKQTA